MIVFDESQSDLERLIRADFGALAEGQDVRRRVLAWLHFKARCIPPRPRQVIASVEIAAQRTAVPAIAAVERALMLGEDVSPWLSDGVRRRKTDVRADPMFNDWQVSHFHLGLFGAPSRAKRTRSLLFAHIRADRAVLLDVQPHGSWAMQSLLHILLRTSPNDLPELKGLLPGNEWTDDQIETLRRRGGTTSIVIGGRVFASPGLGVTGAGSGVRFTHLANALARAATDILDKAERNAFPPALMMRLAGQIGVPFRLGITYQAGVLALVEKNRGLTLYETAPLA